MEVYDHELNKIADNFTMSDNEYIDYVVASNPLIISEFLVGHSTIISGGILSRKTSIVKVIGMINSNKSPLPYSVPVIVIVP